MVLVKCCKYLFAIVFIFLIGFSVNAQIFTSQDTMRGTNGIGRNWWNVIRYDLKVYVDITNKNMEAENEILFKLNKNINHNSEQEFWMQIDLQNPLEIKRVLFENNNVEFIRDGNYYKILLNKNIFTEANIDEIFKLRILYSGKPKEAKNAPWDGGLIFKEDNLKRPFVSVACQGLGASAWYACKDIQSDEPDSGASITIICPDTLVGVGNGKLISKQESSNFKNCTEYKWQVSNPINNYNLVFYIGKYVNFSETYNGLQGKLNCNYYVLDYELEKAKKQFTQTPKMLAAFEYWFGAYPFYIDDYKLVQAPHLGMEHQSAVAYGNKFENGYMGRDLSGTGYGKNWDYILIHESGHEWWGNNITTADIADMWIHEGFTCYSEALFVDYNYGTNAGNAYVQGLRKNIEGKEKLVGTYGVNNDPTSDIYYKGANILHTIRTVIANDSIFRAMLLGLQKDFKKSIVTSKQVENYICDFTKINFKPLFEQYIYNVSIPTLNYTLQGKRVAVFFDNCNANFELPINFNVKNKATILVNTTKQYLPYKISKRAFKKLVNKNYYFTWQEILL